MMHHILKNEVKLLKDLFHKLEQLKEFNHIFAQYLEPHIVSHCKVANLQNGCLIVIVDSGNWATQLRFYIPDLLKKLHQHACFENLKSICCKTRPNPSLEKPQKNSHSFPMPKLSQSTAKIILESAEKIKDKKLRDILKRIAERLI